VTSKRETQVGGERETTTRRREIHTRAFHRFNSSGSP
jgi:hypothetical protein